jgi:DNA-binding NarL/FixJ family response regulator/tRNA A-37 threonylcarbamoyl transferase component Bud32
MIGRTFRNRYEIQELLGEGSTATVYKGLDRRLNRTVALKVLLPHVRESARKRFLQEATSSAALNHPNIMAIYDMDEEHGQAFLVVEYVEGETLTAYVPSDPGSVAEIGAQIAAALDYAHQRQIIHRDIKPANIKVTPAGQVKIMDLGLALPREAKRVTAEGMIIGTPAYLSPEQAQGLPLDYRTDLYSLGVVLYEMATGQLPFSSDDIPALLMQHVRQNPTPPRAHAPDVPLALESVILKALEKNPARRFQSGDAMAGALRGSVPNPDATATSSDAATRAHQPTPTIARTGTGTLPAPPLRVLLADDHTMLRRSLANLLSQRDDIMVVGEASDGEAALQQALELIPDVLVLDLNMPKMGGLEVLPHVRAKAPSVRVLVLTGRDEDWYITQALRAGAHGYILKSDGENNLIESIQKVGAGGMVLGQGVAEVVMGMVRNRGGDTKLTEDERKVLLLVAGGYDNAVIAERIGQPLTTIIEILASAMNKTGSKDRHNAALTALRRGDILLDELHTLEKK